MDAAVEGYNGALLRALREVADEIGSLQSLERQQRAQADASTAANIAYDLALQRYQAGLGNFLTVLTAQMMLKMGNYKMTIVDLPMNIVYGVCMLGFAAMALRSLWVARIHVRRGYSVLERPESTMED